MRTLASSFLFLFFGVFAQAADNLKIYTQPEIPSQEILDRLNLKMLWRAFSPMEGKRDGYHDIQIADSQVIAQTRSGTIVVFNSETGEVIWKTNFGKPYQVVYNLAFNDNFIFAVNENDLYTLDRRNGSIAWQSSVSIAINAPPTVDKHHLFLSGTNKRIYCYALPMFKPNGQFMGYEKSDFYNLKTQKIITAVTENEQDISAFDSPSSGNSRSRGPQPRLIWEFQSRLILGYPLLVTPEIVGAVGQNGGLIALNKHSDVALTTLETNPGYSTDRPVISAPSLFFKKLDVPEANKDGDKPLELGSISDESTAYIGSMDASLHAVNLHTGKLLWRYTVGSTVHHRPFITDNEIFVTGERNGLFKLSRQDGLPMWNVNYGNRLSPSQEKSDRVIAANTKFIYTLDKSGRMLIIDRSNGAYLTTWDIHDFVFPVINRTTDRIFIAANNGLLVCMRDRDFPKPMYHITKPKNTTTENSSTIDAPAPNDGLKKILESKITEEEGKEKPLQELLNDISKKYNIKMEINKKAFAEMMIDDADKKPVTAPAADNIPLAVWLTNILDPLGITYQPAIDTVVLFPAGKPKKDK